MPFRPTRPTDSKNKDKKSTLTPYESPLKMFKFYRLTNNFHAKNGYRSLTYSNKVDPSKPFCKYETSGGTCKDKKCPNQHWRDISKTGGCFSIGKDTYFSNLYCFPANALPQRRLADCDR